MSTEQQQLDAVISGLEAQRALLGDAVIDAALAPLRAKSAALAAQPGPGGAEQSLRQVSVLFLDIVGSTELSRRLDPEDIQAVLDGTLARCTQIVEQHRGKVLQYAGDNLLAAFGADAAREDDAERAVRAALALLDEGARRGEQVQRQHGHAGFNVRVGVHTGSVLLGGGVDAEHSIRGSTVHIAARMEQTAPSGGVRISHATYTQVRGVFDVQPQPPLAVKGFDEPLTTYLVQRAKPRAFRVATRGIEGVETRMIGRDAELEQLQHAFKRVCGERRCVSMTVVGDAGLGKSRLLYEFENWAEARPEAFYIFKGRAHPQTRSQPYGLLRDMLAWRLQIADGDSVEVARHKLEQGFAPLFEPGDGAEMAQAHAHVLGHLIGIDFSASRHIKGIRGDVLQIRNRGFHAAAQMLRRIAAQDNTPVVLLLDDLHYADDGTLDFLNYLEQVNRDVAMLVIGLTRPALFEQRPERIGSERRIELVPLDKDVSRQLVNELLKKLDEVPSALRELITGGAEGNPFYMEELVKMLVDEGAIRTGAERWSVVPDKLVAAHVPPTLTGVLQARLDGLKPAEKLALQHASVIGHVFWDAALAAIDPRAPEALASLTLRELVVPHPDSGVAGLREYAFKHQILHQVTYETVLKRARRECHAKVAAWLAGRSGTVPNWLGATAEHYQLAGDDERAREFFARAAEHAAGRFAHEAALDYVAKALARAGAGAESARGESGASRDQLLLRWRLIDVRERTLDLQGRRAEQDADIDELQCIADALDDDRRRGEAAWRRCDIAMRTSDYRTMETAARRAVMLAARAGDHALRLRAQQRLAYALFDLGDSAAARALAQEGLAAARSLGLRYAECLFANTLGVIAIDQGDSVAMLEMVEQQLLISRELGDRRGEASALDNLGIGLLDLGESTRSRRYLEEGLRLNRSLGDRALECGPLIALSKLATRQGDDTTALVHARAALDSAIGVHAGDWQGIALLCLGNAELALGRHAEAAAAFARADALAQQFDPERRLDALAGLARVALARGDVPAALVPVQALLTHLAQGGTFFAAEAPRLIQLSCYQALTRAADPRAAELLASAYAEVQRMADKITDAALRESFLNQIPENREIVAAWEAQTLRSGSS